MKQKIDNLEALNNAPTQDLVEFMAEIFCSRPLAEAVAAQRPFPNLQALLDTTRSELQEQSETQFIEAVNAHPAIGSSVRTGSFSEREQSAANREDEESRRAMEKIRGLSAKYQEKHGFRFLIRAAGLSSQEILDSLILRLDHSTEEEKKISREQLSQINELRLSQTLADAGGN